MPEEMRAYTDASVSVLSTGYTIGKATASVSETCNKFLEKLDQTVDKQIKDLDSKIDNIDVSKDIQAALESYTKSAKVTQDLKDAKEDLQGAIDDNTAADEDLKAQVATNTAFVTKASECAKEGKGVQVTDKGLVCAADPAPDKCDDAAVGKIKISEVKVFGVTLKTATVCMDPKSGWTAFQRQELDSLGEESKTSASSCAAIQALRPSAKSGLFWVKTHANTNLRVYCLLDSSKAGGGWQLMATLTSGNMFRGSVPPLASNFNQNTPSTGAGYSRDWRQENKPKIGDEFMVVSNKFGWKRFVMTATHCGWASRSTGVCNGCHGTFAKGQIYNEDGTKVDCGGNGCWFNSCSMCGGCSSRQCDTLGFNADHGDYAAWYGGSKWKLYGSGWDGSCRGGWGQTRDNGAFPNNFYYRPKPV
jgi:hypothetical protein